MDSERAPGDGPPIRPASTVMLIRDGDAGLEVFTLRRVAGMAFAGGMTAFPGGGVDPGDADPAVPWYGPDARWWAAQWDIDPIEARCQVVAAVRELFEETAILLAGSDTEVIAGDPADREADREAVAAHRRTLADVLRRTGQVLRADLLRAWARWITPSGQSRRYDTYFFVAALPAGQSASAVTTEATAGQWERPVDLLAAGRAGAVGMLPPTIAMLTDLAAGGSVAEVLATPRSVRPVTPVVLSADGEVLRVLADGREIHARRAPAGSGPKSADPPAAPAGAWPKSADPSAAPAGAWPKSTDPPATPAGALPEPEDTGTDLEGNP